MFPILYEKTVTTPENNGFGFLSDCIECKISETLNGDYFLNMTYPLDGRHADDLVEGRLLYALRDNNGNKQLFRISELEVDYIGRTIQVYAPHISRDLANYGISFSNSGAVNGTPQTKQFATWFDYFDDTVSNYQITPPFTFNVEGSLSSARVTGEVFQSILDWLGNNDYVTSVPPRVEMEYDGFSVNAKAARGEDTDIVVRYGKNLTELKSKTAGVDLRYYACRGYCTIGEQIYTGILRIAGDFSHSDPTRCAWKWVDCTEYVEQHASYDDSDGLNANELADIQDKLKDAADRWNGDAYVARRAGTVTIDFKYLDLAKAGELWDGPRPEELSADIGDYITVVYGSVNNKSEIVAVEYDCLKERYETITAGQLTPTLSQTIKSIARG